MCELFVICSSPFHFKMVELQHCICNTSVAAVCGAHSVGTGGAGQAMD